MNESSKRSAGVSPAGPVRIRKRGYLPHWESDRGCYFVTFRLADSLPKSVLLQMAARKSLLDAAIRSGRKLLPAESVAVAECSTKKVEDYLDSGSGACLLKQPRIASVVARALLHRNGSDYSLYSWCIMPNHVHAVFRVLSDKPLGSIVHAWKSYTAKAANRLLSRSGTLWQREYYDRLIRDDAELHRAIEYVLTNPAKAGLINWPWVRAYGRTGPAGEDAGATT